MGLFDFIKKAGKAIGIGGADAAESAPPAEAIKKEIEDLGLAAEKVEIEVDGGYLFGGQGARAVPCLDTPAGVLTAGPGGQSLLSNGALLGIAGSMAAIDIAKGWAVPGTDAKELFMPNK